VVGLVVLEGRTELEAAVFFKIPFTFGAVDEQVARGVLPVEVRAVLAARRELPASVVLVDPVSLEVDAAVDRVVEGTRGFTVTVDVALLAVVGLTAGRVVDKGFVAATVLLGGVVSGFVEEMTGLVLDGAAADTEGPF